MPADRDDDAYGRGHIAGEIAARASQTTTPVAL